MIEIFVLILGFFIGFIIYKESQEEFPALNKPLDFIEKTSALLLILLIIFSTIISSEQNILFNLISIILLILFLKKDWFFLLLFTSIFLSHNDTYAWMFAVLIILSLLQGRKYKSLKELFLLK